MPPGSSCGREVPFSLLTAELVLSLEMPRKWGSSVRPTAGGTRASAPPTWLRAPPPVASQASGPKSSLAGTRYERSGISPLHGD